MATMTDTQIRVGTLDELQDAGMHCGHGWRAHHRGVRSR